jgi:hypothetical protein
LNLLTYRRRVADRKLLLAHGSFLVDRRLSLLAHRRRLADGKLLLAHGSFLADRRLSLLTHRRSLADGRLSLFTYRRNALRGWYRLGLRASVQRLGRTALGLRRALRKRRSGTGTYSRSHRLDLFCIDRLDLHAPRRLVLPGRLCTQRL